MKFWTRLHNGTCTDREWRAVVIATFTVAFVLQMAVFQQHNQLWNHYVDWWGEFAAWHRGWEDLIMRQFK